ncbi:hypothetical protein AM588_10008625 [Phytophthora nicotianae]|uniref:Uncharacterized protein n=1 Tax=Phytophthora nicotianae TaxID=4792 RepID=A0A0W8DF49_PHYNI|nr:hypothetical protein AM588_10008625 [Phytophthora nicotianae]
MCQTNQRTGEKEDVFRHEESADEVRWVCGEVPYPPDIAKKLEETLQKARSGEVTKNFVPISVAERVADLLMEYVRLAIANAPGSTAAAGGELSLNKIGMKLDLAKSHYQMLAGVCIEYCALIGRTDLLFGEIYTRFKDANKLSVLIELLEPYILSEKLRNLSPVAMEEFVHHFSAQGKLAQVEQCLLHLNVAELDLDTILKLCHDHELYSALIYIYNEGMDDYTTPIDVLLEACSDAKASKAKPTSEPTARTTRAPSGSRVSSLASAFGGTTRTASSKISIAKPAALSAREKAEEEALSGPRRRRLFGYKLLLYISYALSGRTFPKHEQISPLKLGKVRSQICYHLFEKAVPGSTNPRPFPRLESLIDLDARELFNIMGRMFDTPSVEFEGEKKDGSDRPTSRYDSARNAEMTKCPSRLSIVLSLAEVIFGPKSPFSSVEHAHFFMFEARLLSGGSIEPQEYADARAQAIGDAGSTDGASMMDSLMNFLALGPASLLSNGSSAVSAETSQEEGFDKAGREAMLVRLLTKLNKATYNHEALLASVIREKMNRAAVLLYKDNGDFAQAIASYLADEDHEYQMNAFSYIRMETDKAVDGEDMEMRDSNGAEPTRRRRKVIEEAVLTHAPALMKTDGYAFVTLILGQFPNLNNKVIQKFLSMGKEGSKLEFLYLKQVLMASSTTNGGSSDEADVVKDLLERSKLRIADDPAVQERFVRLLCEFEPAGVFPYLESHDSYKVDACLRLCKEFAITDAEAYLLERTGDVTEGKDAMKTLEVALTMCQRNSLRNRDEQAEKLWFTLLDKLLRIQNSVKRSLSSKSSSRNVPVTRTHSSGGNSGHGAMTAFQVALNEMIRFILERMASSVSLKSILFKITNEHGRGAFGDFRPTIFGMLDTYNYEQNIYQTANALISVDLFDQITTLKRAKSRCYAPPSNVCGYCHVALSKPPFGMGQSGAPGTEKWHLHTSMVLVMSGQTFHESCGKAWQQGVDTKTPAARGNPPGKLSRNQSSISSITSDGLAEDEAGSRLQRKQPSTRRYLARLKTQRRASRRQVSPHVVLESLIREDNGRNKYLKSSRAVFSLRPDPEVAASKVKKRLGTRKSGSLPFLKKQEERALENQVRLIRESYALRLEVLQQQYLNKVAEIEDEMYAAVQNRQEECDATILAAAKKLQDQTQRALQSDFTTMKSESIEQQLDSNSSISTDSSSASQSKVRRHRRLGNDPLSSPRPASPVSQQRAKLQALEEKLAAFSPESLNRVKNELATPVRTKGENTPAKCKRETVKCDRPSEAVVCNADEWRASPMSPLRKGPSYWKNGISLEVRDIEEIYSKTAKSNKSDQVDDAPTAKTARRGAPISLLSRRFLRPEEEEELRHLRTSIGLAKDWMARHTK